MSKEELQTWHEIFSLAAKYGAEGKETTGGLTVTLLCILLRDAVQTVINQRKDT